MYASARVSSQISDISPTLTLRRDKVYTTFPSTRKKILKPLMDEILEIENNYAWDKLPNLPAYKSAIVRKKVCQGIMYLIPGDKGRVSLSRPYTTQLNALFKEPYHSLDPAEYSEDNLANSLRIHFSPTTHQSCLKTSEDLKPSAAEINSQSRQAFENYNTLITNKETKEQGSKGNLPLQMKQGPAEAELQQEVNKILEEVDVRGAIQSEDLQVPQKQKKISLCESRELSFQKQKSELGLIKPITNLREFEGHTYEKKTSGLSDYKQLRDSEVPTPKLPEFFKTPYLSEDRVQEIWNWLNWGFCKSQIEHFIEVCS